MEKKAELIQWLQKYSQVTQRQKQYLLNEEIDKAIQLMQEKEYIIHEIDKLPKDQKSGDLLLNELITQINALNQEVITLMAQQQERIAAELRKLQQGKKMQQAYRPAYSPGAYFFDKKK